jgi:thiamine biosynthesis lipoprotein
VARSSSARADAGPDLIAIMAIARRVHDDTGGAFDVTVAAAEQGGSIGMRQIQTREHPPALRKARDRIALDLGGIGPGYAVDCLGERLVELGSADHLVELGGEVRAWGSHPSGTAWRVSLRGSGEVVQLSAGEALATSTARPGRSPVDPRTGRVVEVAAPSVTVRGRSSAEADARAVAELVLRAKRIAPPRRASEE